MEDGPKTPRSDNLLQVRSHDPLLGRKFLSKYRTIKKLGEGSFGKVYKAEYNNEYFALEFENKENGESLLEREHAIMTYLKCPNIPSIKSYGYNDDYNILVMQLMDKSLEEILNKRHKFSVKTTCLLGYQMVNILQYIHDRHVIHRDIKPDNFVMGANEKNAHLYLLDFGLAKKYRSSRTLVQNPLVKKQKLTGTARYASINALNELEQSRRDDLESMGYVLMYFLRGSLPWQGLKVKNKEEKYKKILEKKLETSSQELCKGFPEEFEEFVEYTRKLKYNEEPDYDMLRNKFVNLIIIKNEQKFDYIYDWTTESDLKKRKDENKDFAPSTNYLSSEKKTIQNEEGINSRKKLNLVTPLVNDAINYENINFEGDKVIIINGEKEQNNINIFQSKCCIIF